MSGTSPTVLDEGNAGQFFADTVIDEIDPLQCFEGYYGSYWQGGVLLSVSWRLSRFCGG